MIEADKSVFFCVGNGLHAKNIGQRVDKMLKVRVELIV